MKSLKKSYILKPAYLFKNELSDLIMEAGKDPINKWFFADGCFSADSEPEYSPNTWQHENFVADNLVDSSSFFRTASLVVDGVVVETKPYVPTTTPSITDANYKQVGQITFDYDISNSTTVEVVSDVDLSIKSNGTGNTIVNYSPTKVELK